MGSAKKFAVPAVPTGSSKKRLNFSGTAHKKSEKKNNPNPKDSKEVLGHEIAEVQQLMQQCSERESEINRLKIEIQRLEERISSITKDKISLESNTILLEKSIEALTKQNELHLAQAEAEKKKGNGEVESQILAMKEQSDRDKMKISSLESDLEAARSRISALLDANKVLEQLNADIEKHGRDVSEQVDRLQGLVDGLRDTNGQLQDELDSTRSSLTSIQDGFNEKLQSMLDEGMKECENKTKVANQLVAELKSNMVEADAKVNDLTEKVTLLENENGQSALLNTELQGKVIEFEKRCEELEAAEKANQDEISHKNAEIDTATEKISTLEAKMETNNEEHKRELKERDERRNEALEESRALKEKLDAVALSEAELTKEISSKTAETVDLRAEIDSLTESNGVLTANMETAENELKALREETTTKSLKLNELADDKQMMID
uniref:Uncharacterized protein n=1 Tax=Ciona savignyi TaxID=51511 RepID=H2ZI25_CIOSA